MSEPLHSQLHLDFVLSFFFKFSCWCYNFKHFTYLFRVDLHECVLAHVEVNRQLERISSQLPLCRFWMHQAQIGIKCFYSLNHLAGSHLGLSSVPVSSSFSKGLWDRFCCLRMAWRPVRWPSRSPCTCVQAWELEFFPGCHKVEERTNFEELSSDLPPHTYHDRCIPVYIYRENGWTLMWP